MYMPILDWMKQDKSLVKQYDKEQLQISNLEFVQKLFQV